MKIYTKTGDAGNTGLYGGERVSKADARVDAYGLLDETNAALGMVRACELSEELDQLLRSVQQDLFNLGAELATPVSHRERLRMTFLGAEHIVALENAIDNFEAKLSPLKAFVLPAGCPAAAALHFARTVSRRAERGVVAVIVEASVRDEVLIYINRLSDLLFVLARVANAQAGCEDVLWLPGS